MTIFFTAYMAAWSMASLTAIYLMIRYPHSIGLLDSDYWRYLFQRWKVITFLIAGISLTVIAPYTSDPTWDYVDAAFMSILTYATAPWAIGTLYLFLRGKGSIVQAYVAVCVWLFSTSWSYDLYIVLRDGYYPNTWLANIFLSFILYFSAGLLWNLEWRKGRGVIFGFMEPGWPEPRDTPVFSRIFWFAMPFMILVAVMIVPFVI